MGFPLEHGLEATMMTMRLADLLEVDSDTATHTFYASLLMYAGCTTDADLSSRIFAGGLTINMAPVEFGSPARRRRRPSRLSPRPIWPSAQTLRDDSRMPAAGRYRKPHYAALCEVAEMLAERLGLPAAISGLFSRLTERWDGASVLARAEGKEYPFRSASSTLPGTPLISA
jgi:hypothetical protein